MATLTVATLLALVPPAATKLVIDSVLGDRPLPAPLGGWWAGIAGDDAGPFALLLAIVGVVIVLSVVRVAIHVSGRWQATRAVKRIQMSLRKTVFEHAVRLPLGRVDELKSGGIASILRNDAGSVGDLVFGLIYNPWRAVVQLFGSLVVLAFVDWRLLIGATGLLPVVYLTHRTYVARIRPQYRAVRHTREEVDAQATESFGGMRVVRSFARERNETTRNMKAQHLMGRQELHVWWWSRVVEAAWETVLPLASAGMLLYGGWQVLEGGLTLGDLMMFLAYLLMLLEPVAILAQSATQLQNSLSGFDRVLDLLDEPAEMPAPAGAVTLRPGDVAGRVTFESVTFRYGDGLPEVLREIDLDVAAGETAALVGRSGAGKSTLCHLVARLYDPTAGRVLLDGVDLTRFDVAAYRGLLGTVEQDVFLFDGTVAQNIAYSRPDASDDEIRTAAEAASADAFIAGLADGYETVIGERGVKLSGGQRQRLAIARAILADPKILILDEATSNLDTESERAIQDALRTLMRGRTCFVIAHRLSTVIDADRIVVLEEGVVVESGAHEDLLAADGRYAEMVRLQNADHGSLLAD
ncbi:MAG: ABC transporter ATP-binding protein [Planctomycetota bacterium]